MQLVYDDSLELESRQSTGAERRLLLQRLRLKTRVSVSAGVSVSASAREKEKAFCDEAKAR